MKDFSDELDAMLFAERMMKKPYTISLEFDGEKKVLIMSGHPGSIFEGLCNIVLNAAKADKAFHDPEEYVRFLMSQVMQELKEEE